MLYGVEYRGFHSAIHMVALFSHQSAAESAFQELNSYERLGGHLDPLEVFEIDYRNPPAEHNGERIVYVNTTRTEL